MGWNSWNHFEEEVNDRAIRQIADAMVSSGLREAGYLYVNIDDGWQGDRDAQGELHPNEAVEDKIALSDRFGLWLSFYPFTQDHFLAVVRHWIGVLAEPAGLNWEWTEELEKLAIRWALGRGNRNGRCAYQFARHWVGLALLESSK